jgi:hypothetical protein
VKFYDLLHPASGTVYRLGLRMLILPGMPEVRQRVLVPMIDTATGRCPLVTQATPIIEVFPGESHGTIGNTRHKLLANGWKPAD